MNIIKIILPIGFIQPNFLQALLTPFASGLASSVAKTVAGPLISGAFSKSSAKDQMKFQAKMSNTAHQREIADLKAAGLNPILSAKYGGASTPPGAGYQVPNIDIPKGHLDASTAQNVAKQGQVLDTQVEAARLELKALQDIPALRYAKMLNGVNPATMAMAQAYATMSDGSNSAKSYGTKTNKFKSTQPIKSGRWENMKKKSNTISDEENREIDEYIMRNQHKLKQQRGAKY